MSHGTPAHWGLALVSLLLAGSSALGAGGAHPGHAGHEEHGGAGHEEHGGAGHEEHGGAGHEEHGHAGPQGHAGHGGPANDLAPAPLQPGSLFQLESSWTGRDGRALRLSALRGRVHVLAMVYTHCEHACPRIIADMREIRRDLGDTGGRVGYVLVSLDSDRDDPARLARFAQKTGLGRDWRLLRAEAGPVRELAAALGVRYRRISPEDFLHSNLISVLDAEGVVVHRQIGLGVDPAQTVAAIRALLAARPDADARGPRHGTP